MTMLVVQQEPRTIVPAAELQGTALRSPPAAPELAPSTAQQQQGEQDVAEVCWICLAEADPEAGRPLLRPCKCPRLVHAYCGARWQLQQAGQQEESQCRFCGSVLPSWKDALTPNDLNPDNAIPVMAVVFGNKVHKIPVRPGPEGAALFKQQVKQLFQLPDEVDFDVTFECKAPRTGDKLQLKGFNCYDAAAHCAAVSAAKRHANRSCHHHHHHGSSNRSQQQPQPQPPQQPQPQPPQQGTAAATQYYVAGGRHSARSTQSLVQSSPESGSVPQATARGDRMQQQQQHQQPMPREATPPQHGLDQQRDPALQAALHLPTPHQQRIQRMRLQHMQQLQQNGRWSSPSLAISPPAEPQQQAMTPQQQQQQHQHQRRLPPLSLSASAATSATVAQMPDGGALGSSARTRQGGSGAATGSTLYPLNSGITAAAQSVPPAASPAEGSEQPAPRTTGLLARLRGLLLR